MRIADRRVTRTAAQMRALAARIVDAHAADPSLTPHAIARQLQCSPVTARRVMAECGLVARRDDVSRGHVAAALAERTTGKPLVVETLKQRLARLLPGARLESAPHCAEDAHQVWRGENVLATGASAREAVDRAVFLWGER